MNEPTPQEVQIGRLKKKLNKMRDQRDKARADLEHYTKVISMQPYLESRYKSYTDKMAERLRVKDLEKRVEEQAKLIELLQKNTAIPPWNPSMPYQPLPTFTKCGKCGLNLEGVMGYVCSQPQCPTGLGGVWCSVK
jgi:hypothetical protein